jgi:hypothetical protein
MEFCRKEGLVAVPATSKSISAYLIDFVEQQGGATTSVIGKLSQLRCAFRNNFKLEMLAVFDEKDVADVVKALRFEDWTELRRMEPVTALVLDELAALRWEDTLVNQLIKLSRAVAHDGLLRCGELTSGLRGRAIQLRPDGTGFSARLGRTKTDRTGPGPKVEYVEGGPDSAAAREREWRESTGLGPEAPDDFWLPELVLRNGEPVGIDWGKPMSRRTFVHVLRLDIARTGRDPKQYCGHSFRAGGATDLFASGSMTHAEVMSMGRWKSLAAALIYFRADLSAARKSAKVFRRATAGRGR